MFLRSAVVLVSVFALSVAAPQQETDAKKDLELLQGEWKMESMVTKGQKAPKEAVDGIRRSVEGDKYTVTIVRGDDFQEVTGKYILDPSKKPKAVDVVTTDAQGKEITVKGIYELTGDMNKICMAPVGKDRPTEFRSTEENGANLMVWMRVKK